MKSCIKVCESFCGVARSTTEPEEFGRSGGKQFGWWGAWEQLDGASEGEETRSMEKLLDEKETCEIYRSLY